MSNRDKAGGRGLSPRSLVHTRAGSRVCDYLPLIRSFDLLLGAARPGPGGTDELARSLDARRKLLYKRASAVRGQISATSNFKSGVRSFPRFPILSQDKRSLLLAQI